MRDATIATNYAEALLTLAVKANAVDAYASHITALGDAVWQNVVLRRFLEAPQVALEKKRAVMAPAALEQAQKELFQKLEAAQRSYMELQQDLAMKEQQAMMELLSRLEPVVKEIAEAEGYTYVFEKGAGIFYAPAGNDLTAQVIRKYNQRFPKGSGGAGGGKPDKKK